MEVVYLEQASGELLKLPATEQAALIRAVEKLKAVGSGLGYPHTSAVRGAQGLRELRPPRWAQPMASALPANR